MILCFIPQRRERKFDILKTAFYYQRNKSKQKLKNELNNSSKKNKLKYNINISHLAVIHNETTTGLLNNLDRLVKLSKKIKL